MQQAGVEVPGLGSAEAHSGGAYATEAKGGRIGIKRSGAATRMGI